MTTHVTTLQERIWLLIPSKGVPQLKTILLEAGFLDQNEAITYNPRVVQQDFCLVSDLLGEPKASGLEQIDSKTHGAIPTTVRSDRSGQDRLRSHLLKYSQLQPWDHVYLATRLLRDDSDKSPFKKASPSPRNELVHALERWQRSLPESIRDALPQEDQLLSSSTWRFTKYAPLLILRAGTFSQEPWRSILTQLPQDHVASLYQSIAEGFGVTHIAEQGPIPAQMHDGTGHDTARDNVLRSPLGLRPLYGAFGPLAAEPTKDAFAGALWVTVKQHGIAQVFAPLYTMFANGNVNEKRRVRDISEADWRASGLERATVVDMYAGIGYFAFSYARAGYAPVLCWELNGWSIEGLRRGAEQNGWTCAVIEEDEELTDDKVRSVLDCTFVVFHESNVRAAARLDRLRAYVPPTRHVNCGYLPSSRPSWDVALRVLDLQHGGWIHAHENCATEELESGSRQTKVLADFSSLEDRIIGRSIHVEHVEHVKSYAPGVMHCVFDVLIGASPSPHELPQASSNGKGA